MAHLIDKDALVTEIKKRIAALQVEYNRNSRPQFTLLGKINGLESYLEFINTLEVKEVDVEKEYKDFIKKSDNGRSMLETAKYFFELGLKAQKGE